MPGKYPIREAKVAVHYDEKNNDIHIDLRIPKHKIRRSLPKQGRWFLKDKGKTMHDIAIILDNNLERR